MDKSSDPPGYVDKWISRSGRDFDNVKETLTEVKMSVIRKSTAEVNKTKTYQSTDTQDDTSDKEDLEDDSVRSFKTRETSGRLST